MGGAYTYPLNRAQCGKILAKVVLFIQLTKFRAVFNLIITGAAEIF